MPHLTITITIPILSDPPTFPPDSPILRLPYIATSHYYLSVFVESTRSAYHQSPLALLDRTRTVDLNILFVANRRQWALWRLRSRPPREYHRSQKIPRALTSLCPV
ncbi:hypothetical protein E4U58_005369 [Claviceps cyperi]|nr:hypothetical protein E4U58_005369 [Claviceps cyperi]